MSTSPEVTIRSLREKRATFPGTLSGKEVDWLIDQCDRMDSVLCEIADQANWWPISWYPMADVIVMASNALIEAQDD